MNAGQSAFPLVSTNDLYIEANIRETDLTYVRQGLRRPDGLLIILLYVVFVAVVSAR